MDCLHVCMYVVWISCCFELVTSFTDAEFTQLKVKMRAIEGNQVTQDKKFAAILSSILTKMSQNTANIADMKTSIQSLSNKQDTTSAELTGVKNQLLSVSKDIVDMEEVQNSTSWNISLIESHLAFVHDTLTLEQMSLNSSFLNLSAKVYHELSSDIMDLKSVVNKNHNASGENFNQIMSVVVSLQKDINSSNVQSQAKNFKNLYRTMEKIQNNFTFALTSLEDDVTDLATSVANVSQSVLNISKDPDICFQVNALEPIEETSWYTPLNFSEVAFNTGNGWNQRSAAFKAPVSGTYLFWATITSVNSTYTTVSLRKLGNAVAKSVSTGGRLYHTSTLVYSLGLDVEEFAWFQIEETTKVLGHGQSSFGGTLLFRH